VADLAALKTKIASEIDRDDMTTEIAAAISTSIAYYRSSRFEFNELQASFSTVAQQESYTTSVIPTDVGQIDSLRITVNGRLVVLKPVNFNRLQELATTTNGYGQPGYWAWFASKLFLFPTPDAIYSVLISYQQRKAAPANDADGTTVWTNAAEPLIRACAKKIIYRDVTKDPALFAAAQQAETEALQVLKNESMQLQDEGGLEPHW
jgi:hypothetical protein